MSEQLTASEIGHLRLARSECSSEITKLEGTLELLKKTVEELNGKVMNQQEAAQLLIVRDILGLCRSTSLLVQLGQHESALALTRILQETLALQTGIQVDSRLLQDWISGRRIDSKRLIQHLQAPGAGRAWGGLSEYVHPHVRRAIKSMLEKPPVRVVLDPEFDAEGVRRGLSMMVPVVAFSLLNAAAVCKHMMSQELLERIDELARAVTRHKAR